MRSRKEIELEFREIIHSSGYDNSDHKLLLEVCLDIRDMLQAMRD